MVKHEGNVTSEPESHAEPESETALDTARRQLERVAGLVDVNPGIVERLMHPTKVQRVTVPAEVRRRLRRGLYRLPLPTRRRSRPPRSSNRRASPSFPTSSPTRAV
ncbi:MULTISPECIES: hypothetical protein [unclassified Haladaptatus]|uniref:hypothetical protein n=1 Tax=unclassified Haladaptatus TaxID=2622732 RepID=UPI00209C2434|nr:MULTISPECIES: hypothetical protein [unclassified Haladaptatus]MCO8243493.1 hypothetical protein [Haladaptatus sp. AB643]MCO8254902.1 hypothetical protein [Haladaptatus sp. AB618]